MCRIYGTNCYITLALTKRPFWRSTGITQTVLTIMVEENRPQKDRRSG